MKNSTPPGSPAKNHYVILDGLRGVASLIVILFHICEVNSRNHRFPQFFGHGYLAVDFFFLLSGFVIAYAYDDRWARMSQWTFYKRRLVRLQPMIIIGTVIGAALFYFQKGSLFPLVASTPVTKLLIVMLIGFTMIPLPPSMDIRGGEAVMYPLNGLAWSLFFEYIGNILYAIGLRKLSNRALGVVVFLAALLLAQHTIPSGTLVGGWSLTFTHLHIGLIRLLYPFCAGILLMRLGKRIHVKRAFGWSALLLVIALALPSLGGSHHQWINGLYECSCVLFLFPVIVAIGAGELSVDGLSIRIAKFFGDLSYPLYITHLPLIGVYGVWVARTTPSAIRSAEAGVLVFVTAIIIAYACLKLYDEPVRRWLSRKLLARPA